MTSLSKIAIVTSHPIQYNAPLFLLLAKRKNIDIKVFYTWGTSKDIVFDHGFGKELKWDIPLLDGYSFEFLYNQSKKPGTHHFFGLINPNSIMAIKKFNPDAILVYGWSFYSHLKILLYFKNKALVLFRGDSHLLDEKISFSFRKLLRRILLTFIYSNVDYFFYVGRANKDYYLKHRVGNHKLIFAPHCVDNNFFCIDSEEKENEAKTWKKSLGIKEDEIVLLFVGKFEEKKDPFLLLNAFTQIDSTRIKLIFVGNGKEERKMKEIAKYDSRISFIDFQNQSRMPIVYRLADVLVLPSKGPRETWGLVINEAFACNRPVIVSDKVGCHFDLIKINETGWVFPSGDINQLKNILINIIDMKKSDLNKMGENAFFLLQKWNYNEVAIAIEKLVNHENK
jgi:glycosyltransferase involved in cell wall biosynthesis